MSATPKTSQPQSSKPSRKSRAARRSRRALASSDEDADIRRAHSSDSDDTSTVSDSDTLSSSEDAPNTPAPPATSTDHSVSPPSTRRSKKAPKTKPDESLIPAQPTSWSDLVNQEDGLHSSEPPIIDFADFVSTGVAGLDATPGPSRTEPKQEGGEREPAPVRGRSKSRGGKTHRQAYLERLSEDPSFIPRVGTFWGHDERLLAPELRGMSDWWRGRWNGRGRGGRGRGAGRFANGARPERTTDQDTPEPAPSPPPIERTWGHDGFEKMKDQERERTQGQPRGGLRGRGRGRGRGGRGGFIPRHPESAWTKVPDAYLYSDSSARPQFPGQARVIKVNLPGQWRPSIVRLGRNTKPTPIRASPKTSVEVPAEIVVRLPGKPAKVVPVSDLGPPAPVKPALPEEPETVQPLQDVPPKVVTRLPGANAGTPQAAASTVPQAPTAAPKLPTTEFIPRPAPTSALPAQVLQQTTPAPPKPIPQIHGRTRSQLDAVAFARPSAPATEPSVPLAFGSFEFPPLAPGSAPPPENYAAPSPTGIEGPASAPLPSNNAPSPPPFNNAGPTPTSIRPPLPPSMASFTPPPASAYYNPYAAYTPLDGATYYSTATPPPPPPHGMYYPTNGFFMPPRPRGPVSIRAPGESPSVGVNGGEERAPVPPMWNYYPPHPHSHTHSHSHSHGHNQYYSPSGTPYPPPPGPPQPGYYPGVGEYPGVYDYGNGGMYY